MSPETLKPLTDEQVRRYSLKSPERGYPLLPLGRRLTMSREAWDAMAAANHIVIPNNPRYYITDHPNRLNSEHPERVLAPISESNPPAPEQNALWDSMGLLRDTLGRPLHPRAKQLLTTPNHKDVYARMTFLDDIWVPPKGFKRDTAHAWGMECFSSAYSFDEDDSDLRNLKLAPLPTEKDAIDAALWDIPTIQERKNDIMETHFEMIMANEVRIEAIRKGL